MARDVLEENIYERKTKVMTADNEMNKSLIKGRKNGQKKKNVQVLSYLDNGHDRNNTSQSSVRKLYYRRSFLLLRENRPSGTFSLS